MITLYPPKLEEDFDLSHWSDVLEEIIPVKIKELMEDMDRLTVEYENWSVMLAHEREKGMDDFSLWFWTYYMECRFAPYHNHRKWLNYWLDLQRKIPGREQYYPPVQKEKGYDLERVKEVPIENFYSGQLRKVANRLCGKCPFHEERTGSFFIFTDDNHFHCFSCGEHGDVIAFVMKLRNVDFKEAIEIIK